MKVTEKTLVGELVAKDYRAASVFKKYRIDFCCNGGRSIEDACKKVELDTSRILTDLETALKTPSAQQIDFQSWDLDLLTDYIEKKHHRYVEQKIGEIAPFLEKVRKVHGDIHAELIEIEHEFKSAAQALASHMKKEELILFPFIRKMVHAESLNQAPELPVFETVENPIALMHQEHDTEGERFRKIAALTDNYTPPADACNTYRVTFALLREFEEDLHKHIHLENNILFPAAIRLERKLFGSVAS